MVREESPLCDQDPKSKWNDKEDRSSRKEQKDRSVSKSRSRSRSDSREKARARSSSRSSIGSRRNSRSRSRSLDRRRRSSSRNRSRKSRSSSRDNRRRRGGNGVRLHVGDLDDSVSKSDLEKIFEKYGELKEVFIAKSYPCFGFVVFFNEEDAEDACHAVDGIELKRRKVRVSFARPRVGEGDRFRGPRQHISDLRCFTCGNHGHFARDCGGKSSYGYRRSRSRSPSAYVNVMVVCG